MILETLPLLQGLDPTNKLYIADQVLTWLPQNIPMPTATTQDLIIASAKALTAALQLQKKTLYIFANKVHPNDDTIVSCNKPQPDPMISSPPIPSNQHETVTVPRVPTPLAKLPRVPKYVPPSSTQ